MNAINADIIAIAWLAILCGVALLCSCGFAAPRRRDERIGAFGMSRIIGKESME